MIRFTNDLFKLTNSKTGEVYYCLTLTDVCNISNISQAMRYGFQLRGKWHGWKLEQIDGTHIEWGQIYKNQNRGT